MYRVTDRETVKVDAVRSIEVHTTPFYGGGLTTELWLRINGVPVAYLRCIGHPEQPTAVLTIGDIEVREGHRGQGLARDIMRFAEERYGKKLHTTGCYTPEGFAAFAKHLAVLPDHEASVRCRSMTFVYDWDDLRPNF